jgi:hypothetical protein
MDLLKIDSVTKTFGGLYALRQVSFSITEGEIVSLIDPMEQARQPCSTASTACSFSPKALLLSRVALKGLKPHTVGVGTGPDLSSHPSL